MSAVRQLRPAGEQLLTKQQLAQHLGRSPRWVEMRVREGMPSVDPTARYAQRRFRLAAVEDWLAAGERKAPSPQAERIARLEAELSRLAARLERLERRD